MAFKKRTPEQNERLQRTRSMSRNLGRATISEGGFDAPAPSRDIDGAIIRAGVVGALSRRTTVPPEDLKGISAIRTVSPAVAEQNPDATFHQQSKIGFYAPGSREIHTGGLLDETPYPSHDIPNNLSVGVHEIGHHVDNMAGQLMSPSGRRIRNLGEAEAKAVAYQNTHVPDNSYRSVYEAVGAGKFEPSVAGFNDDDVDWYRANRAAGTMPGQQGVPLAEVMRQSKQFFPDYREEQQAKYAEADKAWQQGDD